MKLLLLLLLLYLIEFSLCGRKKLALSHITILLPYTSHYGDIPTQFKISSHGGDSNGCVQWKSYPEKGVIEIHTDSKLNRYQHDPKKQCPPNTFNEAIIRAVTAPKDGRYISRISATITAFDQNNPRISAECEVFIDKVAKLQVATSTRLIYLGKYESIAVNGFDDKGNKFATLYGIPMKWSRIGAHLKRISYNDARLYLPNILDFSEDEHFLEEQNNPLPVTGIKTGQENVRVMIDTDKNPIYKIEKCEPAEAALFVVMQLQLVPRTLYVAKCCIAYFDLITTSHKELEIEHGKIKIDTIKDGPTDSLYRQKINIPKDQYQFILEGNALKMSIENDGKLTTTNIIENGKLKVEDKVNLNNTADAGINVVDVHSIYAEVVKYKYDKLRPNTYKQRDLNTNWYLTFNEDYLVRLILMDSDKNAICVKELHPTEFNNKNMRFLMNFKSWRYEYICNFIEWDLEIIDHNKNNLKIEDKKIQKRDYAFIHDKQHNEFMIKPSKITEFTLKFTAKGTKCNNIAKLASSSKKVIVKSPVFFKNTSTLFCPYCEKEKNKQKLLALIPYTGHRNVHKVPLFFDGGSGRYRLEINDTNIATILGHDINIGQDQKMTVLLGDNLGKTHLFLIDYFNPDNFAYIDVEVEMIKTWLLKENVVKEVLINNAIEIPLMVRDRYNRRFSSLDGIKEVIATSSDKKLVSLEFIAPTINDLVKQQKKDKDDDDQKNKDENDNNDNTQIVKKVADKAVKKVINKTKKEDINCDDMDGKIVVRGVDIGYDIFTIGLMNKELNTTTNSKMFVSVYKEIQPKHMAVAIAININNPYTMGWNEGSGPNQWPIKELLPVDKQFSHPLHVEVIASEINNNNNNNDNNDDNDNKRNDTLSDSKDFSFRYNGKTLEFICYREFHYFVELKVRNKKWNNLPFPITSIASIEIFCFPQFQFNSNLMEMGVGTRKNAKALYPKWVQSETAKDFFIEISQNKSEIVSVVNNDDLVAKRLGSTRICGQLTDPTQRVYIHPDGFSKHLEIIVLFKGFTMEMASYWIINGNSQIAHIEGLDESHHILPFRHNFDDVFIEWQSEDANIIELLSILPRPNNELIIIEDEKRNNIGTGLSVKLIAHSVGQVNIRAIITLRNPPNSIKSEFKLTQTVTVIPQVVYPCNSIILKPNSSLPLSPQFNPDTNVAGIGQIYNIHHIYSHQTSNYVYVLDKKLNVKSNAPPSENIAVTLILQSPNVRLPHKVKKYPLTQASSLIVSIVEPTGLNLLKTQFITDNIIYSQSINYNGYQQNNNNNGDKPFWSTLSSSVSGSKSNIEKLSYSKTENILCEKQNITLKIAILDELARELHVMDQCKVVSNDTSIIAPRKEIKISTEKIGGSMYGTVQIDALQPGYATITFREKDVSQQQQSQQSQTSEIYVYDDPKFLRTFLTVHVLSSSECQSQFGLIYHHENIIKSKNGSHEKQQQQQQQEQERRDKRKERKTIKMKQDSNYYKNGKNWKSKTAKSLPKSTKGILAICGVFILIFIIGCSWSKSCWDIIFGINVNGDNDYSNNNIPPAAFNPYAPVQDGISMMQGYDPNPFRRNI